MKKLIALLLCILTATAVFSSCKLKEEEPAPLPPVVDKPDDDVVSVPNPMVAVDDYKTFQLGGFAIVPPEGSTDIVCYYIDEYKIAEVMFKYLGHDFTYRASTTYTEMLDISGVYGIDTSAPLSKTVKGEGYDAEVKIYTTDEKGRVCYWVVGPAAFTLFTADELTDDEISAITLTIANADIPFTAELQTKKS